jgi:hypothetical protein
VASAIIRAGAQASIAALGIPWLYRFGSQMLKVVQSPFQRDGWMPKLPPPLNRWTMARPLPAFGADFRVWWHSRTPARRARTTKRTIGLGALTAGALAVVAWLLSRKRR